MPSKKKQSTEAAVREIRRNDAWGRPVFQPAAFSTGTDSLTRFSLDAAGGSSFEVGSLSCRSWRATDLKGLTVDASGSFSGQDCDVACAVACCAPVP
jgi:hypothetical protein